MTLHEFQALAKRTFKPLGSTLKDSMHMTEGMASEYMKELTLAIMKGDRINMAEEFGDIQWFAVMYADIHNIEITFNLIEYVSIMPFGIYIGELCDFDKRLHAYNKDTDPVVRATTLNNLLFSMEEWALKNHISSDLARKSVIEKLKHRYPDKYSDERAVNRDVVGERAVLEGSSSCQ